ncbi:MAG TPA: hypothetical protein VN903_19680 [Polyangia bacterium]|jgi:hypothetical protein|nr:hypothetical protein [Polyangia bacterium]
MTKSSSVASLFFAAGLCLLPSCASRTRADPPPATPASAETASTDAGLPAVPLTRKSIVVPSDVKLDPAPKEAATQPPGISSVTATPNVN